MPAPEDDKHVTTPPGEMLNAAIRRSPILRQIGEHLHLQNIIDDHVALWSEAKTPEERIAVHARFVRQVSRSLAAFGGFEIAVHGAIMAASGDFMFGLPWIMLGFYIIHLAKN